MGTILNVCKNIRKEIREVDILFSKYVLLWKEENGKKEAIGYHRDIIKYKDKIDSLIGKLESINIQLEKDSEVRCFYKETYDICVSLSNKINNINLKGI